DPLTMQALAKEMSFSETVFVLPPQAEDADVRIRIFTPGVELPFAGHPVLGSAFVLGGPLSKIVIRLETGAGVVPVELERAGPATARPGRRACSRRCTACPRIPRRDRPRGRSRSTSRATGGSRSATRS